MSDFINDIPQGKMWGPWLFYINDGNQGDATSRSAYEEKQWPYSWVNDAKYQHRGYVKGQLVLSDGRPASGAAVFLGDEDGSETNNQGSYYQYTTYAQKDGSFTFDHVRLEKNYRLIAWANGGDLADVDGVHNGTMVGLNGTSIDLGKVTWNRPSREIAWRIGDFDKTTKGFKLGGSPYQHGLSDYTPANLIYSIGVNKSSDWYFAQSAQGNWSVLFDPAQANRSATLTLSMAGFTSRSGFNLSDPTVTGLNISMNSVQFASFGPERPSDKSLYRSATTAGAYYQRQFEVPANLLSSTRFNKLDL
jgi:rhamnogalacturonan endolyase